MDQNQQKHLEFIQSIIARMNTNSFQIKGIAVTLTTALLAVYATTPKAIFIFLGILPTIFFWLLDSYYLQQERKFRGIYNDATGQTTNHSVALYQMPVDLYNTGEFAFSSALTAKTTAWLYGSITSLLVVAGVVAHFKSCL
jgi:hypothetical protein